MRAARKIARWRKGPIDRSKEHFELRYGSAEDSGWDEWIPVALIGPPVAGTVAVQFLIEPDESGNAGIVKDVSGEIQFYLIDKKEPNPWEYAKYHGGALANAYSKVHWSFRKATGEGESAGKRKGNVRVRQTPSS